jgi:hypothetical protein
MMMHNIVWCTKQGKQITKSEARRIIEYIRGVVLDNGDWLKCETDTKWSISFIETNAISLRSEFKFFTEYNKSPKLAAAEYLAGIEPNTHGTLTPNGVLHNSECLVTTTRHYKLVRDVLNNMNALTGGKFEVYI